MFAKLSCQMDKVRFPNIDALYFSVNWRVVLRSSLKKAPQIRRCLD